TDGFFVIVGDRLAVVLLVAGVDQRIERKRVIVRSGDIFLNERAEHARFRGVKDKVHAYNVSGINCEETLGMRWKLLLGTGLLQLWLCCAGFSQSPKLEQILPRIQEHVKEFELLLPDFICDETIVSREMAGTFVQHEMVIESTFRGTQHKDEEDRPFT